MARLLRPNRPAVSNILVQNGSWAPVPAAMAGLDRAGLLTARALAGADPDELAECCRPTGLQRQKATRLRALGSLVVERFGCEAAFCERVTRADLLGLPGIGPETADRTLLYACGRLAWPVDTSCLRVLVAHGLLPAFPASPKERAAACASVQARVALEMPQSVETWQRLHALFWLEGVELSGRARRA